MTEQAERHAEGPGASMSPGRGHHRWPRRLLAGICGIILLVMMVLTVVDVIGRYLFNSPLLGATELTELLLPSVIFIGLPAVSLDDEHVTVDLVVSQFPAWIQPIREAVLSVISAGVLSVVAWRLWVYGGQIAGYGGTTNTLRLPVAPVTWLCAACCAIAVLITLYVAARKLRRALT